MGQVAFRTDSRHRWGQKAVESQGQGRLHPVHVRYRQGRVFACEVSACTEIAAPIDAVWKVLTDFDQYSEWNPFTPKVETDFEIGSPVTLYVDMPGKSRMVRTEWVNLVEPEQTICWGMHMGASIVFCANRWQTLRTLDNGDTEYVTEDRMSGLLAPLVMRLYGKPMQIGFQSVADSLKHWIESRNH